MTYQNRLERLNNPPPLLADYPEFVEPLRCDDRYLAPPVVDEADAGLTVRCWRYCTDMCVKATTCGYDNLCQNVNVFIVGDATLATYPASTTPRFATQVALHNAALWQLVTQVGWVK